MDVTIEVTGKFTITAEDVAHPVHGVNRIKKYLKDNSFEVKPARNSWYTPSGSITIQFDEMDLSRAIGEEHVVTPDMWFDQGERENVNIALRNTNPKTRAKINKLIDENNAI